TEAEAHGAVLHRTPRLAGHLGVLQVEFALDVQPVVGFLHRGRVDRPDDALGVTLVVPVQRDLLTGLLPVLDRALERAGDDAVLDTVDCVSGSDSGEVALICGSGGRRLEEKMLHLTVLSGGVGMRRGGDLSERSGYDSPRSLIQPFGRTAVSLREAAVFVGPSGLTQRGRGLGDRRTG